MTLKLEDKKAIVSSVAHMVQAATSLLAADYRGLTVSEMTALRTEARRSGVQLKIVRNTLAKRALQGTSFEGMSDVLVGPMMLAFGQQELSAPARLMRDFAKKNEKLQVKALSLGGQTFGVEHLERVAQLPTTEEALVKLLSVLQAPLSQLVRTLAAPQQKLVRTLAAVRESKA